MDPDCDSVPVTDLLTANDANRWIEPFESPFLSSSDSIVQRAARPAGGL